MLASERERIELVYVIVCRDSRSCHLASSIVKSIAKSYGLDVKVVYSWKDRGLAYGRNLGLLASSSEIVAFIDDDVIPSPSWAKRLIEIMSDTNVDGVYGRVLPLFIDRDLCRKVDESLYWLFSCASTYMPRRRTLFYRGLGANMAFRRRVLLELGGFRVGLGVGSSRVWIGGEEVDLAIRMCLKGRKIIYDPDLVVYHVIPPSRCTLRYVASRAFGVGRTNRILAHTWSRHLDRRCRELTMRVAFRHAPSKMFASLIKSLRKPRTALTILVTLLSLGLGVLSTRPNRC